MKHFIIGLLLLSLTACGDAGDHFLEFRPTNARVVPVSRVTLAMSGSNGQPGTYPLTVTAYEAHGNPIPAGESYTHQIMLTSGGPCPASFGTVPDVMIGSVIGISNTTTSVYARISCSPGTITASDVDMPNAVTLNF